MFNILTKAEAKVKNDKYQAKRKAWLDEMDYRRANNIATNSLDRWVHVEKRFTHSI